MISSLIRDEMSALADGDVGYARTWKPRCWGQKVPICFTSIIRAKATFMRWSTVTPPFTADKSLLLTKQITSEIVEKDVTTNLRETGCEFLDQGWRTSRHVRHQPRYPLVPGVTGLAYTKTWSRLTTQWQRKTQYWFHFIFRPHHQQLWLPKKDS